MPLPRSRLLRQPAIPGDLLCRPLLLLLAVVLPLGRAVAAVPAGEPAPVHSAAADRTYFGQDIYVAPGQEVRNATCFFCSVQLEGDLTGHAFVLFGNITVLGRVDRSVTVIGGNAVVDAQARILGTTAVIGGNAVYESDESLSGDAWVLGGHVSTFAGNHTHDRRRVSLSPVIASGIALVAILLLLPLFFVRRSDAGPAVQPR